MLAMAGAIGLAVFLVAWQAHTLRLDPGGADLAWPLLVAFGMTWAMRERAMRATGAALVLGALVAIVAAFASLRVLPVTPVGLGVGLGVAAAVLAAVCVSAPRAVPLGPAAVGFGVGVAAAHLADLTPTTTPGDVVASATAVVVAMVLGMFATHGLALVHAAVRTDGERRPELTVIDGADMDALTEPIRSAR